LNPQVEGLKKAGVLATASSLCLACEEVCPVKIPFADILRFLRNSINMSCHEDSPGVSSRFKNYWLEHIAWKLWRVMNIYPRIFAIGIKIPGLLGLRMPGIGPFKNWTTCRTDPVFASKSLHELARQQGVDNE
jgi:L-lactate dehydrogenase complex protein LldF